MCVVFHVSLVSYFDKQTAAWPSTPLVTYQHLADKGVRNNHSLLIIHTIITVKAVSQVCFVIVLLQCFFHPFTPNYV